jgi:DNA segregation ATPase FtsK/SpoIIIE, S-DNA-T family
LADFVRVAPDEAPPRLVLIVDEFATLVKELPDFVAGVVDIAQRGRSLGIHLVLATQRPAGAVNENILANTNLRIGLRMLDGADSVSVLGVTDAADIPVPLVGRAFARTGGREVMGFQTAWAGAPVPSAVAAEALTVVPFDGHAGRVPLPSAPGRGPVTDAATPISQLEAIVAAAVHAHEASGRPLPRRPWLDPLPEVIRWAPLATVRCSSEAGRLVYLGRVDRPERQAQESAIVDLEASGGLLVLGMGGAGKTTTLRTIALDAAMAGSPDEVCIFGLDAAGRGLSGLRSLPHTSLVATVDDIESVTRLIAYLQAEIESRRKILTTARAESFSSLRGLDPSNCPPRLLLLIDGYASLQAAMDSSELYPWMQSLVRLIQDGRSVGVHTAIASDRRMSVPVALAASMSARLVLRMADTESLIDAGVAPAMARQVDLSPPGRGLLDRDALVQVAAVGGAEATVQSEEVATIAADLGQRYSAVAGPKPLPDSCQTSNEPQPAWTVAIGVLDVSGLPARVDFAAGDLVISGPPGSGRTTAASMIAAGLTQSGVDNLWLLSDTPMVPGVRQIAANSDMAPFCDAMRAALAHPSGRQPSLVVVVDDAARWESPEVAGLLEQAVRDERVRLILTVDSRVVAGGYQPGWLGELRRVRQHFLLQPVSASEVTAVTGDRCSVRPGLAFVPGRGILVGQRATMVIHLRQLPRCPHS